MRATQVLDTSGEPAEPTPHTPMLPFDFDGLKLFGDDEWFASLFESLQFVHFLIEAIRQTHLHFGSSATVSLDHFIEPHAEGPGHTHFRIETSLEPEQACDRFDEFCEQWWDGAAETMDIVIRPVLDVAR